MSAPGRSQRSPHPHASALVKWAEFSRNFSKAKFNARFRPLRTIENFPISTNKLYHPDVVGIRNFNWCSLNYSKFSYI